MCGVVVEHDGATITKIRGDDDDPLSRGHVCPKAYGLKDLHEDPDRLRVPLKRTSAGWVEIPWDQAFDEVAAKLRDVQARHGRDAVAVYQGNPTVHNHGSMIHGQAFVRALRTKNRYSATSLDQLPQMLAALQMFGHQLLMPVPDLDHTRYLLMIGANPVASNGSIMTAPGITRRLKELRARGAKLVVVDPRRTETAELADRHVSIRPGTDALWMLALAHVITERGAPPLGRLAPFTKGVERLTAIARDFSPERVASATGVDAATTRQIAAELVAADGAAIYGRVGVCTQEHGGVASWLVYALSVLTGNLDRRGGSMFTTPAVDVVGGTAKLGQTGHFGVRKSRVRGLPEFGGEYPVAVLAEELDTPGPGQTRALVTSCGNPVLSAPNGRRLEAALEGLELMVSIDIYLNETTRHAHYVLPPTFGVEKSHYDLAFSAFTVRNLAKWSPALFQRSEAQRHDWEIFFELTRRLQPKTKLQKAGWALAAPLAKRLGPDAVVDFALRTGPHHLSLSKLKAHPHGLDLGPLEPQLPGRLFTADGKIDLVPDVYVADLARLAEKLSAKAPELVLIGRRELRSNNSWMHNAERLVKGRDRCTLEMHPADAAARNLSDRTGQPVKIATRTGVIEAALEITDAVMPGVVCLPHGWGHHRPGTRLRIAEAHAGVSINDVTDEQLVDALTGTIAFSGVPVDVHA
ncbi:molybdopterin-dependent oxidoreductase [Myxococcota bacterium]|nr:molybdopterin-dependent oxidoreductase [Myxococcota bacterium]